MNNQRSKQSTEGKRRASGQARLNIRMSEETTEELKLFQIEHDLGSLGEAVAYLLRFERECGRVT